MYRVIMWQARASVPQAGRAPRAHKHVPWDSMELTAHSCARVRTMHLVITWMAHVPVHQGGLDLTVLIHVLLSVTACCVRANVTVMLMSLSQRGLVIKWLGNAIAEQDSKDWGENTFVWRSGIRRGQFCCCCCCCYRCYCLFVSIFTDIALLK